MPCLLWQRGMVETTNRERPFLSFIATRTCDTLWQIQLLRALIMSHVIEYLVQNYL